MNTRSLFRQFPIRGSFLILISLIPWILFGFLGPFSDATFHLETAAGKYGLIPLDFIHLLYTCAPPLFITPLLFVLRDHWFYWVGSMMMAASSVLLALVLWTVLTRHCKNQTIAFAGALLYACHPFLHQLHFYWMTELAYAIPLLIGLSVLSEGLPQYDLKKVCTASAWIMLSRLMRPQASIAFYTGLLLLVLVPLYQHYREHNSGRPFQWQLIAAWFVIPMVISVPFRILNRVHHNTWSLQKSLGNADGFYLQMEQGSYKETNGPASRQLWDWCADLRRDSTPSRFPHVEKNIVEENVRECINIKDKYYMDYGAPRAVCYIFTNDWERADEFVSVVKHEAIKADPKRFIQWAMKHSRWYLFAPSENHTEWQDTFRDAALSRRAKPFFFHTRLGDHVSRNWGGIATDRPWIFNAYSQCRTVFQMNATRLKRLTTYLLPLMLWLAFRYRPRSLFYFLLSCVIVHWLTAVALGSMTGFHHRYGVPLEVFTLLYVVFWLDTLAALLPRRTVDAPRKLL